MRTVTLEAAGLVEADSAVLTRLTAAVVARVVLTEASFDARRTHAHELAAATHLADAASAAAGGRTRPRRRPACRTSSTRYQRAAGAQLRRQRGGPVDLTERTGEPGRALAAERGVGAARRRDHDTLGAVTTREVEARVAQLARQAAVAARTHARVADDRLGRPTGAVVETRVGCADAGGLLAAHAAVTSRADAAERALRTVVAGGAVDARPTGARVVLVLTPVAAESSQTDADALPLLGEEARAAVETELAAVVSARAVSAHVD